MINALTVDVEDYFQVQAFAPYIRRCEWNSYPNRVKQNTRKILAILDDFGVKATFFILGWIAERMPDLVKEIAANGHEIACHGYGHQMVSELNEREFRDDVKKAKLVTENIAGCQVKGYRAPSYSITRNTLWALEILAEEGFEFDSSIFPVHHDNYGIPEAPRFPYRHKLQSGKILAEFPPSTVRRCGVNLPVAGGGYLRLFPYYITARAICGINEKEVQPAMLYVHPWEFDPDQPRISASWLSRFRHYTNLESTRKKFERLLREFRWAPMSEVLSLISRSPGL